MPPRSLPGILAAVLSMARPAIPDIDGARPVSPEGAIATRTALAVDVLDNAYLAAVLDGKVKAITLGSTFSSEILLSDIRIPQEDPAIEVSPPATAHVVFAQEDNELGAWGREIFYSSNPGGDFAPVLNASGNKIDDRSPDLAIDPDGIPRFVWVRDDGTGGRIVHQKDPRGSPQEIARGEFPSVTVDRGGFSHVVFLRDGAVRAVSQGAEGFGEEKELDRIPGGASSAPRIGVDRLGRLAVAYEADGELRLVLGSAGAFDPPRVLDRDLDPGEPVDAFLRNDGRLSVAYLKEGDLIVIRGSLEEALEPARITRTPQRESSPAAREDLRGNLHISFIRDGRIYYANTAPPPEAEFSAEPTRGELPLEVRFKDLSTGEIRAWSWSFGDGAVSSERNPVHIYERIGTFSVRLEVSGPGGKFQIEKESLIAVDEPSNTMEVADAAVLPGQREVWAPVIGYHRDPIQGFQVAGRFDPEIVFLRELSLEMTLTASFEPEFFAPSIDGEEGSFTAGLLLDASDPFDGRKIWGGGNQRLLHLVFDVSGSAPPGESRIDLAHGIGPSAIDCLFIVDGQSRRAVVTPGKLTILPGSQPRPRLFRRGDVDQGGAVNLSDAILVLQYLFQGKVSVVCADSLDTNDSGRIDLSDAIYLLGYLFQGGAAPPVPFPSSGLDPTDDGLPTCTE